MRGCTGSSSWTPAAYEALVPSLLGDVAGDLRKNRSEEQWMAWMEENNRRKKEVKLRE